MAKTSFPKKRANPRFTFFAEAELTLSDGTPVLGQLSELSAGGCCIDTLQPIPIGTELRLSQKQNGNYLRGLAENIVFTCGLSTGRDERYRYLA